MAPSRSEETSAVNAVPSQLGLLDWMADSCALVQPMRAHGCYRQQDIDAQEITDFAHVRSPKDVQVQATGKPTNRVESARTGISKPLYPGAQASSIPIYPGAVVRHANVDFSQPQSATWNHTGAALDGAMQPTNGQCCSACTPSQIHPTSRGTPWQERNLSFTNPNRTRLTPIRVVSATVNLHRRKASRIRRQGRRRSALSHMRSTKRETVRTVVQRTIGSRPRPASPRSPVLAFDHPPLVTTSPRSV